jgi:hypothetical protein
MPARGSNNTSTGLLADFDLNPDSSGPKPMMMAATIPDGQDSGPGRPGGLLPGGSHRSVRALSRIRLVIS